MNEIRENLEDLSIKVYHLSNLSKLLDDYLYNNATRKMGQGITLINIIEEKITNLDLQLRELLEKVNQIKK